MTDPNKMPPPPAGCAALPSLGDKPINAPPDYQYQEGMTYIACVLTGDWPERTPEVTARLQGKDLGVHYVEHLYSMVSRYMPPGVPWRFVCFTDRRYIEDIPTRPIPEGYYSYFNKLYLFSGEAFPRGSRVIAFDLDTCIVGSLKEIVALPLDKPIFLRDAWNPENLASGVMAFTAGAHTRVWSEFAELPRRRPPFPVRSAYGQTLIEARTDEQWLYQYFAPRSDSWAAFQDLLPTQFASYKYDIMGLRAREERPPMTPERAAALRVIYFHGRPRPHEVVQKWNPFWRGILDAKVA